MKNNKLLSAGVRSTINCIIMLSSLNGLVYVYSGRVHNLGVNFALAIVSSLAFFVALDMRNYTIRVNIRNQIIDSMKAKRDVEVDGQKVEGL